MIYLNNFNYFLRKQGPIAVAIALSTLKSKLDYYNLKNIAADTARWDSISDMPKKKESK